MLFEPPTLDFTQESALRDKRRLGRDRKPVVILRLSRAAPALRRDVQRDRLGNTRSEQWREDARATGLVIVVVTREIEVRITLDVSREMTDVVKERRDDHRVGGARLTSQRGALQRVLVLGDGLAVGLVASDS